MASLAPSTADPFKHRNNDGGAYDYCAAFHNYGSRWQEQSDCRSQRGNSFRRLARVPTGFDLVIKSVAEYRKQSHSPAGEARVPEVRYVVRGITWQHQNIQHANIELIENDTSTQVWAHSFAFGLDEP